MKITYIFVELTLRSSVVGRGLNFEKCENLGIPVIFLCLSMCKCVRFEMWVVLEFFDAKSCLFRIFRAVLKSW